MSVLKIWVNAFIPKTVPGYTVVCPAGANQGKTAVLLPAAARVFPQNWKSRDTGYLTDQREFSSDIGASVRMQSQAELTWANGSWTVLKEVPSRTSGTTEVNTRTGRIQACGPANMGGCVFHKESDGIVSNETRILGGAAAQVPVSDNDKTAVTMYLDAAASDPLVFASAPIRYKGWFFIKASAMGSVDLRWDLRVCQFPAFEAYAQYNGTTATLFQAPPPHGHTVVNLIWGSTEPKKGSVTLR